MPQSLGRHLFYNLRASRGVSRHLLAVAIVGLAPLTASAQTSPTAAQSGSQPAEGLRIRVPTVTVTAQKEPEDKQKLPVSVTAAPKDVLDGAAIHLVSEASILAPNTFFTEWSARKLSSARFRGLGSSPANPAVTTFFDGVPQLNANSSSIELLDVDQIEFVRGPQSALFGRNTLGGLVNVTSVRPSTSAWTGGVSVPFGNYGAWAIRGGASGPVVSDKVSVGVAFAEVDRDGFTVNDVTGNDLDSRSAFSTKAQVLFTPNNLWEGRVIFTTEHARDGDYSLNDVGALRSNPFHAARDFEGHSDRDVFGTTVLARRAGSRVVFSSTTGFLNWKTRDSTDLDYTPMPIATRDNTEDDFQFTQELRFASAESAALQLGSSARLRWQSGLFVFTQGYEQDAVNTYGANVVAPFPVSQHTPKSALDDAGFGLFGQGTISVRDRFDLSGGARFDHESKSAVLEDFFEPQLAPPSRVEADASFSNVSPQVSAAYRVHADNMLYGMLSRGYKAGGFNPASPAGSESYGEEHSWNYEGGVKTLLANGRVSANATVFYIDWDDLQLNVPNPNVPAQFYIANAGGATSKGVEVEISARAAEGVDLFTAVGFTNAKFGPGSVSSGIDVEGNTIPNTPDYTTSAGVQYTRAIGGATFVGRADAVFYGAFHYDDYNSLEQPAYSLVNLRLAVGGRLLTGEFLIRNAFDTRYIPVAFPYPNFAPSGFVGEMGAPRTVSFNLGVRF